MHTGPNIERDGLVFGYDTGYGVADNSTSTRFYPGGPTTNSAILDMTTYAKDNGSTVTATGELYLDQPVYRVYFPPGTLPRIRFDFSHTSGQTWNGSIHYKVVQSGDFMPQLIFRQTGFGTTYTSTPLTSTNWTRANINYTFSTNNNSMFLLYRSTSSSTQPVYIDFAMPQLEQKPYATPFTTGTRSSTQSLIDLTRTTTIDVSNVSFDSTGQPTFDGTDDYLATSTTPASLQGNPTLTVEGVFKRNGTIIQDGLWGIGGGTSLQGICSWNLTLNNEIGIDLWGTSTYGTGQTYSDTEWKHIVWTYNGTSFTTSNISIFVNGTKYTGGSLITRRGGSGIPNINSSGITLGRIHSTTSNYHANGQIANFKVYNRVLSDKEVQQNYRAYKNRFDI
jgi:hypothetical protein